MRVGLMAMALMAVGCGRQASIADLYAVDGGQVRCIGESYRAVYGAETYCRWECVEVEAGKRRVNLIFVGTRLDQDVETECR